MKGKYFREIKKPVLRAWQQLKVMVDFKTEDNYEGYVEYASQLSEAERTNCMVMALRIEEKGMDFVEKEVLGLVGEVNVQSKLKKTCQ